MWTLEIPFLHFISKLTHFGQITNPINIVLRIIIKTNPYLFEELTCVFNMLILKVISSSILVYIWWWLGSVRS